MKSNGVINEDMTLDEKLAAIDAAIDAAMANAVIQNKKAGNVDAPLDPADLTMCIGCQ